MSGQYYKDVFSFTPREIGFTMAIVGGVAVLYQWYFVKFVRKIFDEVAMIHIAFIILIFSFLGFSLNTSSSWLYFWVIFFPLGMGSFHPSVGSLLWARAGNEVGRVMWYNTSVASIGQIIWPIIMGTIYVFSDYSLFGMTISHFTFPFVLGFIIFTALFFLSFRLHK
jgi:MFS family permease